MSATTTSTRPTVSHAPFVVLWFVWALLLAAAIVLGQGELGHGGAAATAARMGSSVVLVIVAWLGHAALRHLPVGRFTLCIAIGMTLGAIGDFFNAGLLKMIPLPSDTLGGIIAFGLGHIAYIVGCVDLARRTRLTNRGAMVSAIIAWQLVGLVGWYFVVYQGDKARDVMWPALPYSLLLAGTAGVTAGLALQDRRLLPLALGGALFLASDLILAFELFRGHFRGDTEAVWLTYGPGQMLIVFSILAAALVVMSRATQAVKPH